jgi:Protein of unknown function (DUF2917)
MESYVNTLGGLRVGNLVSNAAEIDVCLSRDQVFKMNGDKRGIQIACQEGNLWVTQADDPKDYVLRNGDRFIVTRPGLVVVQGVREGMVRIMSRGFRP